MEENRLINVMRKPGKPHKFAKPAQLWELFVGYCNWVDENPWQVKTASNSINEFNGKQDKANKKNELRQQVRVMNRAYTLHGFCAYAGIFSRWNDFKRNNITRRGFSDVILAIENVVCAQQLDGAMIRQFDSSLVARLNGIADTQVNQIVGKDGEEFKFPRLSEDDINELKRINGL